MPSAASESKEFIKKSQGNTIMIPQDQKYIALETYRKDGIGITTPVWYVRDGDIIWVVTRERTGKVRRVRNDGRVRLAVSDFKGRPKGEWFGGTATIVGGEQAERAISLRNKKYWMTVRLARLFSSGHGPHVVFMIRLDGRGRTAP